MPSPADQRAAVPSSPASACACAEPAMRKSNVQVSTEQVVSSCCEECERGGSVLRSRGLLSQYFLLRLFWAGNL